MSLYFVLIVHLSEDHTIIICPTPTASTPGLNAFGFKNLILDCKSCSFMLVLFILMTSEGFIHMLRLFGSGTISRLAAHESKTRCLRTPRRDIVSAQINSLLNVDVNWFFTSSCEHWTAIISKETRSKKNLVKSFLLGESFIVVNFHYELVSYVVCLLKLTKVHQLGLSHNKTRELRIILINQLLSNYFTYL